MENVKCEGCKHSENCYQEECYAIIQVRCDEYEGINEKQEVNDEK